MFPAGIGGEVLVDGLHVCLLFDLAAAGLALQRIQRKRNASCDTASREEWFLKPSEPALRARTMNTACVTSSASCGSRTCRNAAE